MNNETLAINLVADGLDGGFETAVSDGDQNV